MTDLWLFSKLLFEVGMLCGFVPSIFLVYAAEAWAKARRVPARNPSGKVVSDDAANSAAQTEALGRAA
jgi:hypothetical protein